MIIMIGSHNTMSYLPIVNWWQRWQKRWCCCQSKNIEEQYALGVRFFDIRVRYINNAWHFVHNKIDFDKVDYNVFQFLSDQKELSYIRFILDERKEPKDKANYIERYYFFIYYIVSNYNNICIHEARTFWDWKNHRKKSFGSISPIKAIEEMHSSVCNNLIDFIIYGTKECRPNMSPIELSTYNTALNNLNEVLLVDNI